MAARGMCPLLLLALSCGATASAPAQFTQCKPLGPCYTECRNGEDCGDVPQPAVAAGGDAAVVTSTNKGERMNVGNVAWTQDKPKGIFTHHIDVDTTKKFQKMQGIGGAFTDAAAINLANTTAAARDAVLDAYYSERGSRYSMGRVPVGSCDFSTHKYCYVDDGDYDLASFALAPEDTAAGGKVELINDAKRRIAAYDGEALQLFASAWTAPPFLKKGANKDDPWQGGSLSDEPRARAAWAGYLSRFVTEYNKLGIDIWGMTVENEPQPLPGILAQKWETMFFSPQEQGEFLAQHLGPAMRAAHPAVKLLVHDDQKLFLSAAIKTIMQVPNITQYVDGIGVHWYEFPGHTFDPITKAQALLDEMITDRECIILGTEACNGFSAILSPPKTGVDLGNWERGQTYAADVLGDLNAGAVGWTDWNLVLSLEGGPNHAGNVCDAPIVVDQTQPGVYYKQPMYYHLAHFSAYIPRGSRRVATDSKGPFPIEVTAWERADGNIVLVILNRDYALGRDFYIHDPARGYLTMHIDKASVKTVIYSRN